VATSEAWLKAGAVVGVTAFVGLLVWLSAARDDLDGAGLAKPAVAVPAALRAVPPPPPIAETVTARWPARVERAGASAGVAAGEACVVEASFARTGASAGVERAIVRCDGRVLYDTTAEPGLGTSLVEGAVTAFAGPTRSSERYELDFSDTGQRSGRSYVELRSWTGPSRVWRDDPSAEVVLELAPLSEPLEVLGGSLSAPTPFTDLVHRTATVQLVAGYDDVTQGARCIVAVRPHGIGGFDCRAIVRCGSTVLYGAGTSGLNQCSTTPGRVSDEGTTMIDGDPALALDLAAGTVRVEDALGETVRIVELALDPEPSVE
jgi:hypothetical protein